MYTQSYSCFGCGETGDAIDLTAQLLGIGKRDAALRLANDLGLPVEDQPGIRKKPSVLSAIRVDPQRAAQDWMAKAVRTVLDYHKLLKDWEEQYAPQGMDDAWNPLFREALNQKAGVDHLLEELMQTTREDYARVKECYDPEVRRIEARIERYAHWKGLPGRESQQKHGELCMDSEAASKKEVHSEDAPEPPLAGNASAVNRQHKRSRFQSR